MTELSPRTPAKRKARELAKHLRGERPDYAYLKDVFRHLRAELGVEVQRQPKTLPFVPSEAEIRRYYETVWIARRGGDIVLIKTLLYTGVRVAELVRIRLDDVDLDACRISITQGKGGKDRTVPFPGSFKETLALHIDAQQTNKRRGVPLRIQLEEALLHPRRPGPSRPLRRQSRTRAQHATAPPTPLPLHLAKDPRRRRRADPALLRTRNAHVARDLLQARHHRRPTRVRRRYRSLPSLSATLRAGTRTQAEGLVGRTLLTGLTAKRQADEFWCANWLSSSSYG